MGRPGRKPRSKRNTTRARRLRALKAMRIADTRYQLELLTPRPTPYPPITPQVNHRRKSLVRIRNWTAEDNEAVLHNDLLDNLPIVLPILPDQEPNVKIEFEDAEVYETEANIEDEGLAWDQCSASDTLIFGRTEPEPEPASNITARCSNCARKLQASDICSEFITVSANKQEVVTISDALRTVFEPWLKLENERILPNAEIPMCRECLSILAGMFKFYTGFLMLAKEASYIHKLTTQSLLWTAKRNSAAAANANAKRQTISAPGRNNAEATTTVGIATDIPTFPCNNDHETIAMDSITIKEEQLDIEEEILGLELGHGLDLDAYRQSTRLETDKSGRAGPGWNSQVDDDLKMPLQNTDTNSSEQVEFSISTKTASAPNKRVKNSDSGPNRTRKKPALDTSFTNPTAVQIKEERNADYAASALESLVYPNGASGESTTSRLEYGCNESGIVLSRVVSLAKTNNEEQIGAVGKSAISVVRHDHHYERYEKLLDCAHLLDPS